MLLDDVSLALQRGSIASSAGGGSVRPPWPAARVLVMQIDRPLRERADAELVVEGIMDFMALRSDGDLVIHGIGVPGHVSFIAEAGVAPSAACQGPWA